MRCGEFKPYYAYRFLKWKLGDRSPLTVGAKVTARCNLRCKPCPWWKWDVKEADTKSWLIALKKARKAGAIHLIIEGGEPTLRKDLNVLIKYAKEELGMLVILITNGTNDLSKFKPDNFWISIDGVGDVYDQVRGKGVFERVAANIKNNSDAPKIALCTINRLNVDNIEEIASYFSPITDGVWFTFMYQYKGSEKIALTRKEQRATAMKILKIKKKYKIVNSDSFLKSVGKPWKCPSFFTLLIGPDLRMSQGCTIHLIDECRCDTCNMACYGEPAQALNLKKDAIDFMMKSAGLKSKNLFFLKPSK